LLKNEAKMRGLKNAPIAPDGTVRQNLRVYGVKLLEMTLKRSEMSETSQDEIGEAYFSVKNIYRNGVGVCSRPESIHVVWKLRGG
jgi:hypothetical protein